MSDEKEHVLLATPHDHPKLRCSVRTRSFVVPDREERGGTWRDGNLGRLQVGRYTWWLDVVRVIRRCCQDEAAGRRGGRSLHIINGRYQQGKISSVSRHHGRSHVICTKALSLLKLIMRAGAAVAWRASTHLHLHLMMKSMTWRWLLGGAPF